MPRESTYAIIMRPSEMGYKTAKMFRKVIRLADQNPIVAFSWLMGGLAVSMPFVVPPIRKALGWRTNQASKSAYD